MNQGFGSAKRLARWLKNAVAAEDLVAVQFKRNVKGSRRNSLLHEIGALPLQHRIEVAGDNRVLVRRSFGNAGDKAWSEKAVDFLSRSAMVLNAGSVFHFGGGYVTATDRLVIQTNGLIKDHSEELRRRGLRIRARRGQFGVVRIANDADLFECAEALRRADWVRDAMPDFALIRQQLQAGFRMDTPPAAWTDRNAPSNYALKLTRAYEAWTRWGAGKGSIRIAIIDSGIDTDHVDLAGSISAADQYDAMDKDYYQEPGLGDDHGTAVAGLAAGMPNSHMGIRGIAGGCSIISLKIGAVAPNGVDPTYFINHILWAIELSWNHFRADVICMSFALPDWQPLRNVLERAALQGRGGRGCVMVAAAGNSGGPILLPASDPNVLAVTATNQFDEFKSKAGHDGDTTWSSSYGPEADVAAPGVALPSTANTMLNGKAGRRYGLFRGTSFAAPQVAGLAGLILSVNPMLEAARVGEIIKASADKVGNLQYPGGRNDYLGYGRINIEAALASVPG